MKHIILLSACLILSMAGYSQTGNNKEDDLTKQEVKHLKLYPVDADKYVNIYVEFTVPTDFTIIILGSERNNERKWELKAKTNHQQSMDVTQLPEGSYDIVLESAGAREEARFNVKR